MRAAELIADRSRPRHNECTTGLPQRAASQPYFSFLLCSTLLASSPPVGRGAGLSCRAASHAAFASFLSQGWDLLWHDSPTPLCTYFQALTAGMTPH